MDDSTDDEILRDTELGALEDDQDDDTEDVPVPVVEDRDGSDAAHLDLEDRERLSNPELDVADDGTDPLAAYAEEDPEAA